MPKFLVRLVKVGDAQGTVRLRTGANQSVVTERVDLMGNRYVLMPHLLKEEKLKVALC